MCIQEINESSIQQKCETCGYVRDIPFDDITLGIVYETTIHPNIIRLIPCVECRSVEFLFASDEDNGTLSRKHQSVVNELKAQLEKIDRVNRIPEQ